MKANASSSSATSPPELDLLATGRLPDLPTAFLRGEHLDLLAPLRFLAPGELPGPPAEVERRELAEALGKANAAYGVAHAHAWATKLADPKTHVVVTGQQPGVLGGPLLSLSKMAAAVRYAEDLEAAGKPAVAVFWIATEDHDWDEAGALTLGGDPPSRLHLGTDDDPLRPLGDRVLGPGITPILEALKDTARGDEATARFEAILPFWTADSGFGEAFARTMARILGDRAPLFLDSQLPALKKAQAPHLRALIERRHELDATYAAAEREVTDRGLPLQVTPQPGVSPLFLIHEGHRRRIEWRGQDRYGLRGVDAFEGEVEDLLRRLDESPALFSPGVLARPAIQDVVLGSALQLMGPSELSYMTQARGAYQILGIERTWTTLRPQMMVLDKRQRAWLEELDLPLAELLDEPTASIVAKRFGEDFVSPIRDKMLRVLEELEGPTLEVDKSLEKPLRKTQDQITRGLDNFTARVEAAVARRNETWSRRVDQLKHGLVPLGHLQERELSTAFLWIKHGSNLVDALLDQMDLGRRDLNIVEV